MMRAHISIPADAISAIERTAEEEEEQEHKEQEQDDEEETPPDVVLEGYVAHKRCASKRVAFADLVDDLIDTKIRTEVGVQHVIQVPTLRNMQVVLREDRVGPQMLRR